MVIPEAKIPPLTASVHITISQSALTVNEAIEISMDANILPETKAGIEASALSTKLTSLNIITATEEEGSPQTGYEEFTFTLFPNLPTELRNQVWEQVLLEEEFRVIEISLTSNDSVHLELPPLFWTCRESRSLAINECSMGLTTSRNPKGVYVRPGIDVVRIVIQCDCWDLHSNGWHGHGYS